MTGHLFEMKSFLDSMAVFLTAGGPVLLDLHASQFPLSLSKV